MNTTTNKSLPALVLQMSEIVSQIAENGGELSEVLEQAFDFTGAELKAKADSYAFFMERLDSESDYWKAKAEQYAKVSKSCKTLKERLNTNIKLAMQIIGTDELMGEDMRFKLSRSAPKLVLDESLLPDAYKMIVSETVPDKERIKAALVDKLEVSGAKLEDVYSLRKYL